MNRQDIDTRIFQKTAHLKDGYNSLQNWEYFRKNGGVKSQKSHFQDWLITQDEAELEIGLTLMPVKVLSCGQRLRDKETKTYLRHMNRDELYQVGTKFVEILNKLTYKNAYKRFNKRLFIVMVMEGEKSQKALHLHFAMNKPEHMSYMEFSKVIQIAIEMSREFCLEASRASKTKPRDERYHYKADIVDRGWVGYITKELDTRHTHNLYLP
jgi:hypothetical protein